MNPSSDRPPGTRHRILIESLTWCATGLMLATYLSLSMNLIKLGAVFYLSQLIGQIAISAISISKRAWQPAVANLVFGLASLVGLVRVTLLTDS